MVLEARQAGADFSHFYIFAVAETLSLFFYQKRANNTNSVRSECRGLGIPSCFVPSGKHAAFSSSRSRA
jgi:hypothetical protein